VGDWRGVRGVLRFAAGRFATGGDILGRINIFSDANSAGGADNMQVYGADGAAVPEPSTLGLFGVAAALLAFRARRC